MYRLRQSRAKASKHPLLRVQGLREAVRTNVSNGVVSSLANTTEQRSRTGAKWGESDKVTKVPTQKAVLAAKIDHGALLKT